MRRLAIVTFAVCCACSSKEDKNKATEKAPPAGRVDPPAAPSVAGALSCDEVVPDAMRAKHFTNQEINEQGPLVQGLVTVSCSFNKTGATDVVTVVATCHADWSGSIWEETEREMRKLQKDARDVSIGKGGYTTEIAGTPSIHVLDDDTPCAVDVHGAADLEAIARDAIGALTPGALAS